MAFQRQDGSQLAFVGALFWAEHIDNMRTVAEILKNTAKASRKNAAKRKGRRRR